LFGAQAGALAGLLLPWLWPLALMTLALGGVGALTATSLPQLTAWLVIASVGTLLGGIALNSAAALTAALYYLLHTTWMTGALFLLAGLIAGRRGAVAAALHNGPRLERPALPGACFLIGALALAGLPPLSGFVGKVLLMQAAPAGAARVWLWSVVLGAGLLSLVALTRAGSALFWRSNLPPLPATAQGDAILPVVLLLATTLVLSLGGEPIIAGLRATAEQALDARQYSSAVLELMEPPP
jgi:multicomponent K+:H+ antiporter subunit D